MPFNAPMFGSGLGSFLGGMFGDSGKPYDSAMDQYQQWTDKAQATQQPFLNAGHNAIGDYQKWLQGQQDPSKFMGNLMNQYQESPYAQYLQQQSLRGGQNAASASGMLGSTPFLQQMQQNSGNIASGDMEKWLQNVLGINTQYGQGQQNLMTGGQNAANALTNLYSHTGDQMANTAYGRDRAKEQSKWDAIGGGASMVGSFFL